MIELIKGKLYLFGEKVIFQYKDENDNNYVLTKGFNRYYLYRKSTYPTEYGYQYTEVAHGLRKINEYRKANNLKEVNIL